jgi:hemoglobin/transferrin/lactoferrin receptor protein
VRGVEAQFAAQFTPQWQARFSAFWNDGEVDQLPNSPLLTVREPLDLLMPATVSAALRWDSPTRRWMIEGVASLSDRADKLSTRDILDVQRVPPGGTPGFSVVSVRSRFALTPQINLALAVDNLGDREYRIHGSGLNEPGRNVVATLNWAPK